MAALQLSFWPTHSEWLSLPNAFNMDPLVSNSWIRWWWLYFDHNVVVANFINCDHLIKRDPTGASTWLIIMTTITAQIYSTQTMAMIMMIATSYFRIIRAYWHVNQQLTSFLHILCISDILYPNIYEHENQHKILLLDTF